MLDTIGFALATAFLAGAFTVFGVLDRLVAGIASELRYSVAPGMVDGVRAWVQECGTGPGTAADDDARGGSEDAGGGSDGGEADGGEAAGRGRGDPGLVVPVTAVSRRGWPLFGSLVRALAAARPATRAGA